MSKFKKKKMKLKNKQQESYEKAKNCYNFEKKFEEKYPSDKKYRKFGDHYLYTGVYRGSPCNICILKYSTPFLGENTENI